MIHQRLCLTRGRMTVDNTELKDTEIGALHA